MAISRVKTWSAEVLTFAALNAEFDNILNNALSLVSPWTANMAAGGFRLTGLHLGTVGDPSLQFTGDTNTGLFSPGADQLNLVTAGVSRLSIAADGTITIGTPWGVASGGTGLTTGTSGGILGFTAAGTLASSAALTLRGLLLGGGAGATPTSLGAATNGQLPIGSTGANPVLASLTAGANITITPAAGAITIEAATGGITVKAANFTRDISLASGTQAVTGIGFIPKTVFFVGTVDGNPNATWGFDNGVSPRVMKIYGGVQNFSVGDAGGASIVFNPSVGNQYSGKVLSFDADGFTITWTKAGSPTGTLDIQYLAMK